MCFLPVRAQSINFYHAENMLEPGDKIIFITQVRMLMILQSGSETLSQNQRKDRAKQLKETNYEKKEEE